MIMAIFMVALSMANAFATQAPISDANTMAQALNKLGMISGDGKGNYNLSAALKRSEAATFVIRLLGKYNYVLEYKDNYINTGFDDVKPTDWYAAYVGYCKSNSIISGLGQNKFGPKENVTEKAFLGMTMRALGYTSDDFSWSNVYQKAYEIGLVTDESYIGRVNDNREYKREEVVKVMYKALTLKVKGTDTTLIKKLILDGAIDPQLATNAGFISDETPTAITNTNVLGEQWIILKVNEQIRPIGDSNIQISESDNKAPLGFKIVQQTDTEFKIKTETQKSGVQYTLKLLNITDLQENVVREVSTTFKGYDNRPIESDLFKISKVEQRSGNELEVYFTHPVNINAEQPDYYQILQGETIMVDGNKNNVTVKAIEGRKNVVLVTTKNFTYQGDNEYTIKIKGSLISAYGTNLGLEAGDQKTFIAKSLSSEKFKLIGITSYNSKVLQLDFNKPLNKAISENLYIYKISQLTTGTQFQVVNAITADNQYGKDCAVILTTANSMDSKFGYSLTVDYLIDTTRQEVIEKQQYSFNPSTQANSDLKIVSVLPIDQNCIKVMFDKNIDKKSAEDITNFTVIGLNNSSYVVKPKKAVYSAEDPKSVKLYIEADKIMTSGSMYKVNVATTFMDFTGTKISLPLEYNFIANSVVKARPEITKAAFISKDTVKISFSKDIALDIPNIMTNNYYIEVLNEDSSKRMPLAINYFDNNVVVLKFDKVDLTKQYVFKYYKIKDITGDEYSGEQLNTAIVQGQ